MWVKDDLRRYVNNEWKGWTEIIKNGRKRSSKVSIEKNEIKFREGIIERKKIFRLQENGEKFIFSNVLESDQNPSINFWMKGY